MTDRKEYYRLVGGPLHNLYFKKPPKTVDGLVWRDPLNTSIPLKDHKTHHYSPITIEGEEVFQYVP